MPKYTYDHIHLRTKQTRAMAEYFERMFDAKIVESIQSDGVPRIDLDIDGLMVFIAIFFMTPVGDLLFAAAWGGAALLVDLLGLPLGSLSYAEVRWSAIA